MINKSDILKMVHHVSRRSRGRRDRRLIHPERDWVIGLGIFLGIVIAGGIYNLQLYQHYRNLEANIEVSESDLTPYKAAAVEKALDQYRVRQERSSTLRNTAAAAVVIEPVPDSTLIEDSELDETATSSESALSEDI